MTIRRRRRVRKASNQVTQGEREVWASGGREPPISGGREPPDFYEKPPHSMLSPGPLLIDGFEGREPLKPGKEKGKGRQGATRVPALSWPA